MINPNLPAFPYKGLTVRQEFSIRILAGFAADPKACDQYQNANEIAKAAIGWADALIEELNR